MMTYMAGLSEGEAGAGTVTADPVGSAISVQNTCYDKSTCIPFFQKPTSKDGKCGCEIYPEMMALGVFLLPVMPVLMLVQNQCGRMGTGDHGKYGDESKNTFCRTLNSPSMAIPALALNLVGWWLIYKTVFKSGGK